MTFIYAFLMVGIAVTVALSVAILRKLSATTDNSQAVARVEAAAAKLAGVEGKVRQQSETVTGIEPAQPKEQ